MILIIVGLALSGCLPAGDKKSASDPEPLYSQPLMTPRGWKRLPYVAGMSVAVPPTATVARPQGIDSTILRIDGPGYSMDFDDYGAFAGSANRRIGGRLASVETKATGTCRSSVTNIQLPVRVPYLQMCPSARSSEADCASPAGQARISARCVTDAACGTVANIIDTIGFAPPSNQPLPMPDPHWHPPAEIC